jgi:hypothetical protein
LSARICVCALSSSSPPTVPIGGLID